MHEDCRRRKDITECTGIPDAHVQKMMTTRKGTLLAEDMLARLGRPVGRRVIEAMPTSEMGPEEFARRLLNGRVKLKISQERLNEIVKEHLHKTPKPQNKPE